MNEQPSRRQFFLYTLGAVAGGTVLAACKSTPAPLDCTDTSALLPMDATMRQTTYAYQDKSTTPGKQCSNCAQFTAAGPTECGSCKLVKGPINPGGYCKSWAAKPA